MPSPINTRVPVDDNYAAIIGKAVYLFVYYEWVIIWIIEFLEKGFVAEYCRGKPMTSGVVEIRFRKATQNTTDFSKVSKVDLEQCRNHFKEMIVIRNALIHAHPITDLNGTQILNYQTQVMRPLPDMKWQESDVEQIITTFDEAAANASVILDKLRI
jgi:hypothetical protein